MKSIRFSMTQDVKRSIFRVGSKYGMTVSHVVEVVINQGRQKTWLFLEYVSLSKAGPKKVGDCTLKVNIKDMDILEIIKYIIQNKPPSMPMLTDGAFAVDMTFLGDDHDNNESKCLEHSMKARQRIKRNQVLDAENNTKLIKSVNDTELLVNQFSAVMSSVGCLMSQFGKGSIFRVGSKYGMTAAHAYDAIINPGRQERWLLFEYFSPSKSGPAVVRDCTLKVTIKNVDIFEIIQNKPPSMPMLTDGAFAVDVSILGYAHDNNESKCLEHSMKTRQRIKRNQVEDTENNTKLRKPVDDTLSELLVDQFSAVMKPVGCLMSQYGKGTIFRAGSKYGITAAHVVAAIINPHNQERDDYSRLCRDQVYVSFSESGPKFKLAGKVVFLDSFLDVAIVEFRDEIIQALPPALSILTCSAFPSDVAVIGYGHGNNESKCLEHSVKVIDPESVRVDEITTYLKQHQNLFKTVLKRLGKDSSCVDEGYTGYKDSHRILMNAYLGKGASGSPIFTKADPAALQVVGIFTCGYPKVAYELPATIKFPYEYTFEAGTTMDFIYNALKSENQELAEDIFSIK